jgi:uncharacterized membrane protein
MWGTASAVRKKKEICLACFFFFSPFKRYGSINHKKIKREFGSSLSATLTILFFYVKISVIRKAS